MIQKLIEEISTDSSATQPRPLIIRVTTGISNVYLVESDHHHGWALIDCGMAGYGTKIRAAAEAAFGKNQPPSAILLTHAHRDHVGSARHLLQHWHVPLYAHQLELPYLLNDVRYPPKDPTVGGFMPFLSRFMDISRATHLPSAKTLPLDGSVPGLPGWETIETPGHTPGHVAFYHLQSRTLISGDAILTVNTDSPFGMLTQSRQIDHPPAYATYDWHLAEKSVKTLAKLKPLYLAAGHGSPIDSPNLPDQLAHFAKNFPIPKDGRYVRQPAAFNNKGPTQIPRPVFDPVKAVIAGGLLMTIAWCIGTSFLQKKSNA